MKEVGILKKLKSGKTEITICLDSLEKLEKIKSFGKSYVRLTLGVTNKFNDGIIREITLIKGE